MAPKLSALLVQDRVVSFRQMDAAVQRQRRLGGRVDTNLLELGHVAEDTLLTYLERQTGLLRLELDVFSRLDGDLFSKISAEEAIEHGVIPTVRASGTSLLAVIDPPSEATLTFLESRFGESFQCRLVLEFRFWQVADALFGHPCPERFYDLQRRHPLHVVPPSVFEAATVRAPIFSYTDAEPPGLTWTIAQLGAFFDESQSRDQVLLATLGFVGKFCARRGLFVARRDGLKGFGVQGFGASALPADQLRLTAAPDSAVAPLLAGDSFYLGSVEGSGFESLYESLDVEAPANLCAVPVRIGKRAALVLVCDHGSTPVDARVLPILFVVANRLGAALVRLIADKKRQRTGDFERVATGLDHHTFQDAPPPDEVTQSLIEQEASSLLGKAGETMPAMSEGFQKLPEDGWDLPDFEQLGIRTQKLAPVEEKEAERNPFDRAVTDVIVSLRKSGEHAAVADAAGADDELTNEFERVSTGQSAPVDVEKPEPTVPEPTVPEPTVPEPTVPAPTVPEPTMPEPTHALDSALSSEPERQLAETRESAEVEEESLPSRFGWSETLAGFDPSEAMEAPEDDNTPKETNTVAAAEEKPPLRPPDVSHRVSGTAEATKRVDTVERDRMVRRISTAESRRIDETVEGVMRTEPLVAHTGDEPVVEASENPAERAEGEPDARRPSQRNPQATVVSPTTSEMLALEAERRESGKSDAAALPPPATAALSPVSPAAEPRKDHSLDASTQNDANQVDTPKGGDSEPEPVDGVVEVADGHLATLEPADHQPEPDGEPHEMPAAASGRTLRLTAGELEATQKAADVFARVSKELEAAKMAEALEGANVDEGDLVEEFEMAPVQAAPEAAPEPTLDEPTSLVEPPVEPPVATASTGRRKSMTIRATRHTPVSLDVAVPGVLVPEIEEHGSSEWKARTNPELHETLHSSKRAERDAAFGELLQRGGEAFSELLDCFPEPLSQDREAAVDLGVPIEEHGPMVWLAALQARTLRPLLLGLVQHESADVRYYAAELVARSSNRVELDTFSQLLFDVDRQVRDLAITYLEPMLGTPRGERIRRDVRSRLEGSDAWTTDLAIGLCADLLDADATQRLIQLLEHSSQHTRNRAAAALSKLTFQDFGVDRRRWEKWFARNGDEERMVWLLNAMVDSNRQVRENVARELRAIPRLVVNYDPDLDKRSLRAAQRAVQRFFARDPIGM